MLYDRALTAADQQIAFRETVRAVARSISSRPLFCPKSLPIKPEAAAISISASGGTAGTWHSIRNAQGNSLHRSNISWPES